MTPTLHSRALALCDAARDTLVELDKAIKDHDPDAFGDAIRRFRSAERACREALAEPETGLREAARAMLAESAPLSGNTRDVSCQSCNGEWTNPGPELHDDGCPYAALRAALDAEPKGATNSEQSCPDTHPTLRALALAGADAVHAAIDQLRGAALKLRTALDCEDAPAPRPGPTRDAILRALSQGADAWADREGPESMIECQAIEVLALIEGRR